MSIQLARCYFVYVYSLIWSTIRRRKPTAQLEMNQLDQFKMINCLNGPLTSSSIGFSLKKLMNYISTWADSILIRSNSSLCSRVHLGQKEQNFIFIPIDLLTARISNIKIWPACFAAHLSWLINRIKSLLSNETRKIFPHKELPKSLVHGSGHRSTQMKVLKSKWHESRLD